jgi:3-deoxy-D-manno-octulosonic-acid transferase
MREQATVFLKNVLVGVLVVVCASTRVYKEDDEAALLLQAWKKYRGDALLVIVPRHPEQFQKAV